MKNISFLVKAGVVTSLAGVSLATTTTAQVTGPTGPGPTGPQGRRPLLWKTADGQTIIKLRNVTPRTMMWWLDPSNNPVPLEVTFSRKNLELDGFVPEASEFEKKCLPHLPAGITRITPMEAQNAIAVAGTAEGVEEIKRLVAARDERIRQIEIDASAVEIDPAEAKSLFTGTAVPLNAREEGSVAAGGIAVQDAVGDFQERLKVLVEQKKAKLIRVPRLTAINSLTARLASTQFVPALVGIKDEAGQFGTVAERGGNDDKSRLFVVQESAYAVTPSINPDESIRLTIMPSRTLRLTADTGNANREAFPLRTPVRARVIVDVKDSSTIALTGFSSALFSTDTSLVQRDTVQPRSNVVLFVTTRILRPLQDIRERNKNN